MAMLYRLWVLAVVGLFATSAFNGWRMGGGAKEKIDPSVRSSPGGYRSFHFWHSGFSGGK
jgi:hypothetical protein